MSETATIDQMYIPEALLRSQELLPSAKLVWIALMFDLRIRPEYRLSKSRLAAMTGLSRPTIYKALRVLQSGGWYSANKRFNAKLQGSSVTVSARLLFNKDLSVRARLFQGLLQLTSAFRDKTRKFKYSSLSKELQMGVKTVRDTIGQLVKSGWLHIQQTNQLAPITFALRNPIKRQFGLMKSRAEQNLEKAEHKGEALMKEFLSLIIASDHYMDNVKPGFLRNVNTDHLMEIDRYYPNIVAFEFNGSQHYYPSELYSAEKVEEQKVRDKQKRQLCDEERIKLIVVHPEDLTVSGLLSKIGNLLPLRNLQGGKWLVDYLERCSARYRKKCPPSPSGASI